MSPVFFRAIADDLGGLVASFDFVPSEKLVVVGAGEDLRLAIEAVFGGEASSLAVG